MNYLIVSNSYHLTQDEIKRITNDNYHITYNMNSSSIVDILEEASYISLDNQKKYIVVSNVNFFDKEKLAEKDALALESYLTKPNPNTTIIFTTSSIDKRKKITKLLSNNTINKTITDKREITNILNNYLNKCNYKIDYNTLNYIMNNSYNNIDIMFLELDKIMMYYNKPCNINYEDVVNLVASSIDDNNFHFVDAVINKDLKLSLSIYKDLKVRKVDEFSLIILLAREYRLMYYVKHLHLSMNELTKYLGLMDWQVNKLYNNAIKYSEVELLDNLVSLSHMDVNLKKGIWDKEVSMYAFLMDACS